VKILTANATRGHQRNELEYMNAIRNLDDDRPYISMLRDDFEEQGPHGVHLCLVIDIFSTDVASFLRSAPDKRLSLHLTKMIVALMVESLESLHDFNIIHTGLYGSDYMSVKR
jgi:serine/threonine-protein kinase SRPK3